MICVNFKKLLLASSLSLLSLIAVLPAQASDHDDLCSAFPLQETEDYPEDYYPKLLEPKSVEFLTSQLAYVIKTKEETTQQMQDFWDYHSGLEGGDEKFDHPFPTNLALFKISVCAYEENIKSLQWQLQFATEPMDALGKARLVKKIIQAETSYKHYENLYDETTLRLTNP